MANFPGLRALAWHANRLYASRGYQLLSAEIYHGREIKWQNVGAYKPARWRTLTAPLALTSRLFRDGFHALAVLSSGHVVAAVAGAIVTLAPGEEEFRLTHGILRGTRPLHIVATPEGRLFWGEYFDNSGRGPVHVYSSIDRGLTWTIAYTFPANSIRHVHNIVFDEWANCFWILTGDNGRECRILQAACDFSAIREILAGNQQARAVAAVSTRQGLYFSSDTPLEENHVYLLDRRNHLEKLGRLSSSSIYGCRVNNDLFFSTMVEPSEVNTDRHVRIYAGAENSRFEPVLAWQKDSWPMGFFQYGNAFLPDGQNSSGMLAVSTIAVREGDQVTSLWRIAAD